jgi:predicted ATPase
LSHRGSGQPHVTAIVVNRLAQRDIATMIDRVTGNKLLPASVRQDILERTDGVPRFVEEMTKAVLGAEVEQAINQLVAAIPSPTLAVPASLHASLMARLDRLGQAKEVAQVGAVIGREFSLALLFAVARKPGGTPIGAQDRGVEKGMTCRTVNRYDFLTALPAGRIPACRQAIGELKILPHSAPMCVVDALDVFRML